MKRKAKAGKDVVSAFDAKTHLSELLRETERGHSYTIERHGKPVARLVPPEEESRKHVDRRALVEQFRKLREGIAKRGGSFTAREIREMIEEGRRY